MPRSIGGFNSSSYGSFGQGDEISARALNRMGVAIDRATTMPSQGIQFQASNGGVAYNDPQEVVLLDGMGVEPSIEKVNHYECQVVNIDGLWKLKVARSGNIWRPMNSDCNSQYRTENITVGPLLVLTTGIDPLSPWASNNGYVTLDGATLFVYAYQVETADDCNFYIYVSLDAGLDALCPVTLPDEIEAPTVAYTVQVIRIADIVYGIDQWIVSQFVLGAITWPQTFDGGIAAEYVNQFQLAIKDVDIGEGVMVPALKIASGGHIYRPINSDCDETDYTENLTADPSGPSPVDIVTGTGSSRPWASSDGYVNISAGDFHVYAFKVENATEAQFYIYVSKSSDKLDACPVPLPPGIAPLAGFYSVQGVLIGSISYDAGWTITQNIVGSITWPNANAEIAPPEQFEVRVEAVEAVPVIRVARGRVIAGIGSLPPNAEYQMVDIRNKSYDLRNIAVYPTGSAVVGMDSSSVWANNDGYIEIPAGATEVGVYLMRNQNKQFPAFNNLVQGWPYLAIMVRNSDADVKTRPWYNSQGDGQNWWSIWLHTANYIDIENPPPTPPTRFYGEDGNDISYGPPSFKVKLQNYNCQRFKIADLTLDGETGIWSVKQYLIGSLTLPHGYCYSGVYRVAYSPTLTGYPTWWEVPEYSANQENWEKNYTGYTKWDGSGVAPTSEVDPI